MCSENKRTIKELLLLEYDKMRSKNKETLELGLELGSLQKGMYYVLELTKLKEFTY